MVKIRYAETFELPGDFVIGHDGLGLIQSHINDLGYSMSELDELYIRRSEDCLHVNFKVYEHEWQENHGERGEVAGSAAQEPSD